MCSKIPCACMRKMLQVSEEATFQLAEREGKVAAVIKALREALRGLDAKLYVRPLLTSYSALGDVHGALRLIKEAKEEQLSNENGHRQGEHPLSETTLSSSCQPQTRRRGGVLQALLKLGLETLHKL